MTDHKAGAGESRRNPGLDPGPVVEVAPKRVKRPRKIAVDEPDLIGAK